MAALPHASASARQAFLFIGVTYLFSWTLFAVGKVMGVTPLLLLGIWGPSLTALALTLYYYGREGLRKMLARFGRVRVGIVWWIVLLALPATVHLIGRTLWQAVSPAQIDLSVWFSVGNLIGSILIAGLGEELGWRGFVLPRLQMRFSPIMASLILAAAHFFWHMPTYWLGQGIHNVPMVFAMLFVVPWTIVFTWIYNRSGGSLLFAVLFHAISNTSLSLVRFMPLDSEVPISPALILRLSLPTEWAGPYLTVVAVYWALAIGIVLSGGLKPANTDIP